VTPLALPALPQIAASKGLRILASRVDRTQLGPIVRTSLWLTYENATPERVKAALRFDLPEATSPSGFAFVRNGRYVPGRLAEVESAWRDVARSATTATPSGVLTDTGSIVDADEGVGAFLPSLAPGERLRVRLYTIGFVRSPRAGLHTASVASGTMRVVVPMPRDAGTPAVAVAQRFGKERFVMGLVRSPAPLPPVVGVVEARYGDGKSDLDVTERVRAAFVVGAHSVWARDADLGDPHPGTGKTLRLTFVVDGASRTETIEQGYRREFGFESRDAGLLAIQGVERLRSVRLDERTFAFFGRRAGDGPLVATLGSLRTAFRATPIPPGADAARLWAYQMINGEGWAPMQAYDRNTILAFVRRYGVPNLDAAYLASEAKPRSRK